VVQGQPDKNETPSQPIKLDVVAGTCHPSYLGSINRRISVQTSLDIKVSPYLKKN
jgi:hypothetical protein